jgi:Uma2 family endonuclease
MSMPQRDATRYTYRDYRQWHDDRRRELIDGVVYDMTPAPSRRHQDVLGDLHVLIHAQLRGTPCRVYLAPFDVRLPSPGQSDDDTQTVVQPDLAVICAPGKLDDAGCRGAPDWVIEILSPSTAAKDQVIKRELYERHGVREYWLVHPLDRVLTVYVLEDGHYGSARILAAEGETPVESLPGVRIPWAEVFPPEAGTTSPGPG